jgi:hypothetical protein
MGSGTLIETRSIDYVPLAERHGKVWHLWPVWNCERVKGAPGDQRVSGSLFYGGGFTIRLMGGIQAKMLPPWHWGK